MAMSERVARLRQQSLDAVPSLSCERAELLTEFTRQNLGRSHVGTRCAARWPSNT